MRRLILFAPLILGCHSATRVAATSPSPNAGRPNPSAAVGTFLDGLNKRDWTAIGDVWGTPTSLVREQVSKTEFEQRALIMACYLSHDSFRILSEAPDVDGAVVVAVELSGAGKPSTTTFRAVSASPSNWLVTNADLAHLAPRCAKTS